MCIECFDLDFKVGELIVDTGKFRWDTSRANVLPRAVYSVMRQQSCLAASFVCNVLSAWPQGVGLSQNFYSEYLEYLKNRLVFPQ